MPLPQLTYANAAWQSARWAATHTCATRSSCGSSTRANTARRTRTFATSLRHLIVSAVPFSDQITTSVNILYYKSVRDNFLYNNKYYNSVYSWYEYIQCKCRRTVYAIYPMQKKLSIETIANLFDSVELELVYSQHINEMFIPLAIDSAVRSRRRCSLIKIRER